MDPRVKPGGDGRTLPCSRVPGATQHEARKRAVVRCRTGTVTHTAFATVPEQRRTASLTLALHRIRDTRVHLRAARAGCTIMHSTATER
jgi:hypothetical protein